VERSFQVIFPSRCFFVFFLQPSYILLSPSRFLVSLSRVRISALRLLRTFFKTPFPSVVGKMFFFRVICCRPFPTKFPVFSRNRSVQGGVCQKCVFETSAQLSLCLLVSPSLPWPFFCRQGSAFLWKMNTVQERGETLHYAFPSYDCWPSFESRVLFLCLRRCTSFSIGKRMHTSSSSMNLFFSTGCRPHLIFGLSISFETGHFRKPYLLTVLLSFHLARQCLHFTPRPFFHWQVQIFWWPPCVSPLNPVQKCSFSRRACPFFQKSRKSVSHTLFRLGTIFPGISDPCLRKGFPILDHCRFFS